MYELFALQAIHFLLVDNDPVGSVNPAQGLKLQILPYRHVHPHFDLHVLYSIIESFILLTIPGWLICVYIILVIAVVFKNFSITETSRAMVHYISK